MPAARMPASVRPYARHPLYREYMCIQVIQAQGARPGARRRGPTAAGGQGNMELTDSQ